VCEGLVAVAVSLEKRRAGGQHLAPCTSLRLLLRLRHTASYLGLSPTGIGWRKRKFARDEGCASLCVVGEGG
jgi:hypothetical protein